MHVAHMYYCVSEHWKWANRDDVNQGVISRRFSLLSRKTDVEIKKIPNTWEAYGFETNMAEYS